MLQSKYLRYQFSGFVLWNAMAPMSHAGMRKALNIPDPLLSAGFVVLLEGGVHCYGDSATLQMCARPDDSAALAAQMGSTRHVPLVPTLTLSTP